MLDRQSTSVLLSKPRCAFLSERILSFKAYLGIAVWIKVCGKVSYEFAICRHKRISCRVDIKIKSKWNVLKFLTILKACHLQCAKHKLSCHPSHEISASPLSSIYKYTILSSFKYLSASSMGSLVASSLACHSTSLWAILKHPQAEGQACWNAGCHPQLPPCLL